MSLTDRRDEQKWRFGNPKNDNLIYFDPGVIKNNFCIAIINDNITDNTELNLERCEQTIPGHLFDYSTLIEENSSGGQIRVKNTEIPFCITQSSDSNITIQQCRDNTTDKAKAKLQMWEKKGQQIVNQSTGMCLSAKDALTGLNPDTIENTSDVQPFIDGTILKATECIEL
jgi:hypothetical protein